MSRTSRFLLTLFVASLGLSGQTPAATPKVDINSADQFELESLPGIGSTRARMIIRIRKENGPFESIEELRSIPRLSNKQFERLRVLVKPIAPPSGPPSNGPKSLGRRSASTH